MVCLYLARCNTNLTERSFFINECILCIIGTLQICVMAVVVKETKCSKDEEVSMETVKIWEEDVLIPTYEIGVA